MTNIETIARRAGVSRGTVDRVLHNRGRVKAETAEKVWAVMEELNFQPNSLGRAFYLSRKQNKIGVLVSFREPAFQHMVMEGVQDASAYARQHSIEPVIAYAPPDDRKAYLAALQQLLDAGICGLALRGIECEGLEERLSALLQENIPIITCNQDIDPAHRSCFVGQDSYRSGQCAAHLMEQITAPGSPLLVVGVDKLHYSSEDRIRGFLDLAGLDPDRAIQVIYGQGNHDFTRRMTAKALSGSAPAGIFVSGAGLSGAAQAVEEAGLSGRIKLVGYDITETNRAFMEKGTVQFLIDQGPYQQGYAAVQLLVDSIFQDKPLATDYFDTGIQIRNLYNC